MQSSVCCNGGDLVKRSADVGGAAKRKSLLGEVEGEGGFEFALV
jgi:hypothetical protein